jgi:hypothetical protein
MFPVSYMPFDFPPMPQESVSNLLQFVFKSISDGGGELCYLIQSLSMMQKKGYCLHVTVEGQFGSKKLSKHCRNSLAFTDFKALL